jgi:hypothetical protein
MTSIQLERLRLALESQLKELGILRRHQTIAVERIPDRQTMSCSPGSGMILASEVWTRILRRFGS